MTTIGLLHRGIAKVPGERSRRVARRGGDGYLSLTLDDISAGAGRPSLRLGRDGCTDVAPTMVRQHPHVEHDQMPVVPLRHLQHADADGRPRGIGGRKTEEISGAVPQVCHRLDGAVVPPGVVGPALLVGVAEDFVPCIEGGFVMRVDLPHLHLSTMPRDNGTVVVRATDRIVPWHMTR